MNVVFRCDASIQIGTGHVMRCLTLADELSHQGVNCHFICREHEGNLINFIAQKGHVTHPLPLGANISELNSESELLHAHWLGSSLHEDALHTIEIVDSINPEWLIVDHYALDKVWEEKLRDYCKAILVIDDLADRYHDCDILVDQTYGRNHSDYIELTPANCRLLCGSEYALLRPEFKKWRPYSLQRRQNGELNHILINLGGVDKDNITSDILEAIKRTSLPSLCHITVVMGSTAPWLETVKHKALELQLPVEVKSGVSNMAELMSNCDLAIGAAGSTSWERCCLGLPTIMLVIAENQALIAKSLQESGAILKVTSIDYLILEKCISQIIKNDFLFHMSQAASSICDGLGIKRISSVLSHNIS